MDIWLAVPGSCWKPTLSRYRGHIPKNGHVYQLKVFCDEHFKHDIKINFGHLAAAESQPDPHIEVNVIEDSEQIAVQQCFNKIDKFCTDCRATGSS